MLPQDPDSEMPDRVSQLVAHMLARADAKHLIELFKGQGLGLRNEQQDETPKDQTPCSVPGKGTLGLEGCQEIN